MVNKKRKRTRASKKGAERETVVVVTITIVLLGVLSALLYFNGGVSTGQAVKINTDFYTATLGVNEFGVTKVTSSSDGNSLDITFSANLAQGNLLHTALFEVDHKLLKGSSITNHLSPEYVNFDEPGKRYSPAFTSNDERFSYNQFFDFYQVTQNGKDFFKKRKSGSFDIATITVDASSLTNEQITLSFSTVELLGVNTQGNEFTITSARPATFTLQPKATSLATCKQGDKLITCTTQPDCTALGGDWDAQTNSCGTKGDVNCDDAVKSVDAAIAVRKALDPNFSFTCNAAEWSADANCDGSIKSVDAALIIRMALGNLPGGFPHVNGGTCKVR